MTGRTTLPAVAALAVMLAACGSSSASAVPQTGSNRPLTGSTVDVRPSGNTDFVVDAQTVTFQLDNAGLLHVNVGITSHAATTSTVTMTATLLDASGGAVGSATGGAIGVAPAGRVTIELTGNRPAGVIAAVTLVIAGQPAPTPRT